MSQTTLPILTIVVPTYNRSQNLRQLLTTLVNDDAVRSGRVIVSVFDNASTDDTEAIVRSAKSHWNALNYHRHATNLGADGNFCYGVSTVTTRWFWILGDDDVPKQGAISLILSILGAHSPAILYINNEASDGSIDLSPSVSMDRTDLTFPSSSDFLVSLNIWLTFISGVVIDKSRLTPSKSSDVMKRYSGTSFVQLSWTLPLLSTSGPFIIVHDKLILATVGNTGGYKILTTFCVNFPAIIHDFFADDEILASAVIRRYIRTYLPGLVWGARFRNIGSFVAEDQGSDFKEQLGRYIEYTLLIRPLLLLPKPLALPFFALAKVVSKLS